MPRSIVVLLLAATSLCAVPAFADRIPLEPGPDTTVFDGPLRDDGTVDYIAAMNAELAEGVSSEENAFVLLWRARPSGTSEGITHAYAEMLGFEEGEDRPAYIHLSDYLVEQGVVLAFDEAYEQVFSFVSPGRTAVVGIGASF